MVFHFSGRERLFWPLETPNELGVVLAAVVLGSTAAVVVYAGSRRLAGTAGLLLAAILLGLTYSRSAFCATFAGFAVLATLFSGRDRYRTLLCGGAVILVLLAVPRISSRLSPAEWAQDESATNRLAVWSDSLHLLADHPGGVSAGNFPRMFNPYYKRAELQPAYLTAVNTYLTVGCFHGVGALGLFLAIVFGAGVLSGWWAHVNRSPFLVAAAAIQTAFATAAFFNTFLTSAVILTLWAAAIIVPLVFVLRASESRRSLFTIGAAAGIFAALAVGGMLAYGHAGNPRAQEVVCDLETAGGYSRFSLKPRNGAATGLIVVAFPADRLLEPAYAASLRRFARFDREVVAYAVDSASSTFLDGLNEKFREHGATKPIFITFGTAARLEPEVQAGLQAVAQLLTDIPLDLTDRDRSAAVPSLVVAIGPPSTAPSPALRSPTATGRSTVFLKPCDRVSAIVSATAMCERWLTAVLRERPPSAS